MPDLRPSPGAPRLRARHAAFVLLILLAVVLVKGIRAYQWSRDGFRPPHGPIEVPPALLSLGPLESTTFRIPNSIDVRGWYLPSRSRAAILFIHGSPGTRTDLLPEAEALVATGYGALLLDVPGHGESTGAPDWGRSATDAIHGGIDFLARRPDVDPNRIGAFGFSMGSSVVALAATEDRRIRAVVLTGVFADQEKQIEYDFRGWGPVTAWPAVWAAREERIALDRLRPATFIARVAPTPILFVTGTSDTTVPPFMTRDVFDRAGQPKELFVVPGASHGLYAPVMGAPYFARLQKFFDKNLPVVERRDATP